MSARLDHLDQTGLEVTPASNSLRSTPCHLYPRELGQVDKTTGSLFNFVDQQRSTCSETNVPIAPFLLHQIRAAAHGRTILLPNAQSRFLCNIETYRPAGFTIPVPAACLSHIDSVTSPAGL